MPLYAAIDLHSNNNYLVVVDEQDQVVLRRRSANELGVVVRALEPFREAVRGVVVESTYNWYWLVDGLMERGYRVHLANTAAVEPYQGLKYSNDWSEAQWLAHLLRLGVLKEGFIYPKEHRPLRDLLRKREQLVEQRTTQLLSLGNVLVRSTGARPSRGKLAELNREQIAERLSQPQVALQADCSLAVVRTLDQQISRIEKEVREQLQRAGELAERLRSLLTVWGVGEILGMMIVLETGPLGRFPAVEHYGSYSRTVKSERISNGRKKGENNKRCGNSHLAWAWVQAANYAARYYPSAQAFVARKTQQGNRALGIKALANKLCRASYYVMRDRVAFEPSRVFGP